MSPVVTRFAPSPTGLLHLGNVRTALLNWLFARKYHGRFLLRFEDTDKERSQQRFIDAIQEDLLWLGLKWDGEVLFQSSRAEAHRQALRELAAKGLAYRCFCSRSQLALDRKLAAARGVPPRYSGRCRKLSSTEAEARAAKEPFVWRLAVHAEEGEVAVADMLRKEVRFLLADLDDPVVVRSDGGFTFLLPNAIDDALDGITHVIRGDDHLTNSAYQVWLLNKLGYQTPVYLHHGLLLGQDSGKLSKRSGSHSVAKLREEGLLPEALVQAMARVGHPNIPEDALDLSRLAAAFDPEHLSTSAVRWSDDEMWRWHTRLLHAMPVDRLLALVRARMPNADREFVRLIQPNLEKVQDALSFSRLLDAQAALGAKEKAIAAEAGADFFAEAERLWRELAGGDEGADMASLWKAWVAALRSASGRAGRSLFMPLRIALTGACHGPEMSAVLRYLGKRGVSERLQDIQQQVGA